MSFAAKVVSSTKNRFFYITANDNNGEYWYFMFAQPSKLNSFRQIKNGEVIDLADYGDILISGFGREAPAETIQAINAKYNCQF